MENKMEKIVSLCKRRGFVFPNSEIYGGLASAYDYGPLGVELKNNIKNLWWKFFISNREDMVGIDGNIISSPKVWEASGHIDGFTDPLVECRGCHKRFRADHIETFLKDKNSVDKMKKRMDMGSEIEDMGDKELGEKVFDSNKDEIGWKCEECGEINYGSEPKNFNLLFETHIGPIKDKANIAYLRGETAQNIFINYKNVLNSISKKLPFGIGQIGKSFRNEITTGNFIFRTFEFEQMEIEYFIPKPKKDDDWNKIFEDWLEKMHQFLTMLGLKKEDIVDHEIPKDDLAFYSKRTVDVEYKYPFGQEELWGLAYRTDYDLARHQDYSKQDLRYFDPEAKTEEEKRYLPHVVEPAVGVDRLFLAAVCSAYAEEKDRVVLKLPAVLAPYKIAVAPLLANKPELIAKAREIFETLKKKYTCVFDDRGNIGKRYKSQDEIGTPYFITVDFDSLQDNAVTVRDRDTMKQERVKIENLEEYFENKFGHILTFI